MQPSYTRPLHKRLALHPLTVFGLMCLGVFIVGTTFRAGAETLNVTATVHAAPLTSPAIITSHYDQQHTTEAEGDIAGTCPADSYVKLFLNDAFAGVANCESGQFSIPVVLQPGANKLQVKAYNITDDEGPVASAITVYYDRVTITPEEPVTPPTGLTVSAVGGTLYRNGILMVVGNYPTFSGLAPPFSKITITVRSDPIQCFTTANKFGWWGCTFTKSLEPGIHTVEVVAVTPDGRTLRFPIFYINVLVGGPTMLRPEPDGAPLLITADYRYQARYVGEQWQWDVALAGGVLPYKVSVDWGDGTVTNHDRTNSERFTIAHAYSQPGLYKPTIRVVDANGQSNRTAVMQLLAIVKPRESPAAATTSGFDGLGRYLWIIWPTYLAVLLMVLSFWLGEQQVLRQMRRH